MKTYTPLQRIQPYNEMEAKTEQKLKAIAKASAAVVIVYY
jgi:hypothetical protein